MQNKQEILGQYFTKSETVAKLLDLLFQYKKYSKNISILEPSFGTGNFIKELSNKGYSNITGYEIDKELTPNPKDFFDISLNNKFDLIVGNPPFTKYNLKESYYYASKYNTQKIKPETYLEPSELKLDKQRIENVFILKALKHLKDKDSSLGFVLPISFFIKNKNSFVKRKLQKTFSTIVIYQNDKVWFDRNIPCCFALFTNSDEFRDKIIIIYENGKKNENVFDISNINEELIPQVIFHKNHGLIKNERGIPLKDYFSDNNIKAQKSFKDNNISAKNILEKNKIPKGDNVEDYKIAVVRVGNSSVGKCGLINIKKDILNDMFYIFDFKDMFNNNREIKEKICQNINSKIDYFRNITCRVGSKSIKKENVYDFKVSI
jgi:hypothetical protein